MRKKFSVFVFLLLVPILLISCVDKNKKSEEEQKINIENTPEECVNSYFSSLNKGENAYVNNHYLLGVPHIEENNKEYMDALRTVIYSSEVTILNIYTDEAEGKANVEIAVNSLNYGKIMTKTMNDLVISNYDKGDKVYDFGNDKKNKFIENVKSASKETNSYKIALILKDNKWIIEDQKGLELVQSIVKMSN